MSTKKHQLLLKNNAIKHTIREKMFGLFKKNSTKYLHNNKIKTDFGKVKEA